MRRLTLTEQDIRDLLAGGTINAMAEDGEELITSAPDLPPEIAADRLTLDQIAVGLSTKHEWDSGELEWIALAVSGVRPFDGNGDTTPREYLEWFARETGREGRVFAHETDE